MKPDILVSVVIPVKNGDNWLKETIPAILNQQVDGSLEIIAIDSGSTDETLSILSKYPVSIAHINPEDFNHGLTRNMGARLAKGKYVAMTVQDAKPASASWLQELLNGFIDNTVAGVCGQQIVPHHMNKNPVEWYRPVARPELKKYFFPVPGDFNNLSGREQLAICRWDDVNAIYRKDILAQLPFAKTDFAEDALWAKDALLAGYAIVYNPTAQVEHYHQEDYLFAFRRNFIVHYHFYKYFGVLPPKNNKTLLRFLSAVKVLIKERGISPVQKWKWLMYNYRNWLAVSRSNRVLLKGLENNKDSQLDDLYGEICKSIPQALTAGKHSLKERLG